MFSHKNWQTPFLGNHLTRITRFWYTAASAHVNIMCGWMNELSGWDEAHDTWWWSCGWCWLQQEREKAISMMYFEKKWGKVTQSGWWWLLCVVIWAEVRLNVYLREVRAQVSPEELEAQEWNRGSESRKEEKEMRQKNPSHEVSSSSSSLQKVFQVMEEEAARRNKQKKLVFWFL